MAGILKGLVLDPDGKPFPGINVTLMNTLSNTETGRALTNSNGEYSFNATDGSYEFVAIVSDNLKAYRPKETVSGCETLTIEVIRVKNETIGKFFFTFTALSLCGALFFVSRELLIS